MKRKTGQESSEFVEDESKDEHVDEVDPFFSDLLEDSDGWVSNILLFSNLGKIIYVVEPSYQHTSLENTDRSIRCMTYSCSDHRSYGKSAEFDELRIIPSIISKWDEKSFIFMTSHPSTVGIFDVETSKLVNHSRLDTRLYSPRRIVRLNDELFTLEACRKEIGDDRIELVRISDGKVTRIEGEKMGSDYVRRSLVSKTFKNCFFCHNADSQVILYDFEKLEEMNTNFSHHEFHPITTFESFVNGKGDEVLIVAVVDHQQPYSAGNLYVCNTRTSQKIHIFDVFRKIEDILVFEHQNRSLMFILTSKIRSRCQITCYNLRERFRKVFTVEGIKMVPERGLRNVIHRVSEEGTLELVSYESSVKVMRHIRVKNIFESSVDPITHEREEYVRTTCMRDGVSDSLFSIVILCDEKRKVIVTRSFLL